jgi:hypothetical protein
MTRVKIDARSLDKLSAQMKAGPRVTRSAYRKGLKDIGNTIRDDAKARIVHVSPETAALLKTSTSIPKATVTVQGGSKAHRIGKLLEGEHGEEGFWEHPLFGDRKHWYAERRHPHLYPAFQKHKKKAMKDLRKHVIEALRAIDLKTH